MNVAPRPPLPPGTKGWCPSLLRPMLSGDGLIARLKPTAATMRTAALRPVMAAARAHGNGHCELTRRGNLQARGFDPDGHAAFADVVVGCGLGVRDMAAEARRTVLSSPLSPMDDPSCAFDAHDLARDLERAIAEADGLAALPGKFGIAIDGGGALAISDRGQAGGADITIAPVDGEPALVLAGCSDLAAAVSRDHAVAAVLQLMHGFAGQVGPATRRMRDWVAGEGAEAIFARAGLAPKPVAWNAAYAAPPVGRIDLKKSTGALAAAAPFGRLLADQISELCDLADDVGDGTIRLTPWRGLVLPGIAAENAGYAIARCEELGLITEPDDPRLRIAVCTGAPGCRHAHAPVLEDAERLAAHWHGTGLLHVSGCSKGCAHSGPAEVTLVAGAAGYDWIGAGGITDPAAASGLSVDDVAARLREACA